MAEKEIKTEVETEETSNTFGGFNNKYVKGAFAAILSAYAAKKDPYLLKGFADKVDELEKADRERRNKFIESATSAATTEIARNKLRRLQRREKIAPEIKTAVENGMNPVMAGKAYKTGNLATFMKIKASNPTLDINALYTVSEEFKNNMGSFLPNDVIESITGPTLKLQNAFNNLKEPRRLSPISNLLSDGTDTSAQDEIQRNIDAQTPSSDDYKPIDFSKISLSEQGKRLLEKSGLKKEITLSQAKKDVASTVSGLMKLSVDLDGDTPVFKKDKTNNAIYADDITTKLTLEAQNMTRDVDNPFYNDLPNAINFVKDKYTTVGKDGVKTINISKINEGEERNIIPEKWTPSASTKEEILNLQRKSNVSEVVDEYQKQIQTIKEDSTLTTVKRNAALKRQTDRYKNKIKGLIKTGKATQDDLAKITY